jgi:hypothetical protein
MTTEHRVHTFVAPELLGGPFPSAEPSKIKVKLFMCLTKHRVLETYGEEEKYLYYS